jgi:hypothetical protein
MRRFEASDGRQWDVVLGRESWGAHFALFVPVAHDAAVRQAPLRSSGYDTAQQELNAMPLEQLVALFERSTIKEDLA